MRWGKAGRRDGCFYYEPAILFDFLETMRIYNFSHFLNAYLFSRDSESTGEVQRERERETEDPKQAPH